MKRFLRAGGGLLLLHSEGEDSTSVALITTRRASLTRRAVRELGRGGPSARRNLYSNLAPGQSSLILPPSDSNLGPPTDPNEPYGSAPDPEDEEILAESTPQSDKAETDTRTPAVTITPATQTTQPPGLDNRVSEKTPPKDLINSMQQKIRDSLSLEGSQISALHDTASKVAHPANSS